MKKFLTFFLTALLTFTVGWAATVRDVLNREFTGVTGTSYTSWSGKTGDSGAVYAGNSAGGNDAIQIRSTNSNSGIVTTTSGGKVKKITISFNSNTPQGRIVDIYGKNTAYSAASDLYNSNAQGTKIGSAERNASNTPVNVTISGDYQYIGLRSKANPIWITSITIEWEQGGTTTLAAPTITPNGGEFLTSQQVTLSAEDGASIYYTLDGNDPTTSSTLYEGAFTLTATTTVKAIAVKDGATSTVASATFTKTGVETLADANALDNNTSFTFVGNVVVTYSNQGVDGRRYSWLRDLGTTPGAGVFYNTGGALDQGTVLAPGWSATKTTYSNWIEYTNATLNGTNDSQLVEPYDRDGITLGDTHMNEYISLSNIEITGVTHSSSNTQPDNYNAKNADGSITYILRNMFNLTLENGKKYNIQGVVCKYQNNMQIYPTSAEEVVTGDPTITLDPTSLTIDDSGTNNSFTVTARNLHENDNGNVSVAHNWVFNTTLTSGTNSIANWNGLQGFNRNYRSVDGTVTVNFEGRALTATDTYTVATEGTSQTLTVTYVPSLYIVGNFGNAGWNYSAEAATPMTNDGNGIYTATLQDIPANSYILFSRKPGVTYNWENDGNRLFIGTVTDGGDFDASYSQSGTLDTNPYDDNPVKYHPIVFPEGGTYTITIDANAGTFNITKEVVLTGDFTLVTDDSQLAAGNEVIIVNSGTAGAAKALSTTQNTNNRPATDVNVSPNLTVTATDETQIITLEGDATGWYFNVGNGGYLYAASNSSNHLKTHNTLENSKVAISIGDDNIASVVFQGQFSHNVMQYNEGSNLFSCYASASQSPVYIYQRTAQNASLSADKQHITLVTPAGADESEPQTFTVTGSNLNENVTLTVNNDNFVLDPTSIVPVDGSVSQEVTVTYVGESAVNENATITITSSGQTVLVYVHGSKAAVTLAQIESSTDLLNKTVTVDGQLIGVWAVNNGATKLLWAKDQGQASIDKRPARTEAQDDYMVNRMKYQHYEFEGEYDWDESNWVILDFANLDGENPDNYVGHKLANKSVTGTYDDANEYTLTLTKAPSRVNEDEQDAPEYPGYNGDDKGQHDASNYGKGYRWAYNSYMPANFMPDNLNRIDADTIAGAHSGEHALPNMQNQQLYFMNPKIMEVAHLWGVWCGSGSDKFSIYTVGMENNETVNAWDLHGAVDVISWKYNNKGGGEYSQPYLEDATAQDFHAVIVRKNRGNSLMAGVNNDPSSSEYGIYPLDLPEGGHPTAVREVNAGKQVLSVRYYNVMGVEASQPFDGVNIIVTRYTDGSSSAIKVIK